MCSSFIPINQTITILPTYSYSKGPKLKHQFNFQQNSQSSGQTFIQVLNILHQSNWWDWWNFACPPGRKESHRDGEVLSYSKRSMEKEKLGRHGNCHARRAILYALFNFSGVKLSSEHAMLVVIFLYRFSCCNA